MSNFSLESDGSATLKYWKVTDSSKVEFVSDAPAGGGQWCVKVHSDRATPFHMIVLQQIALFPGNYRFQFSVYGKSNKVPGGASLIKKHGNSVEVITEMMITDSVWTNYSITPAVTLEQGDSLFISLSGGSDELLDGTTSFDLIQLTWME